jgi:molybdopterin synthase catalytic subunit
MSGLKILVRLFAGLRERAGTDLLELSGLPEPLDVATLKGFLQERHAELGSLESVRGVVGTSYATDDTLLEDGQEVSLLPPVSGGAPDEGELLAQGVFEIHAEDLEPEEARRRVTDETCGACCVFTGTTRETNRGNDVVRLDYEAFHEMAGAEMARIYAECTERFAPEKLRMLTLHRTGAVAVGQPSVVIAVASAHRDAAFGACRFLIDELKQRVPLWKKELYQDGHHWIGERS